MNHRNVLCGILGMTFAILVYQATIGPISSYFDAYNLSLTQIMDRRWRRGGI